VFKPAILFLPMLILPFTHVTWSTKWWNPKAKNP